MMDGWLCDNEFVIPRTFYKSVVILMVREYVTTSVSACWDVL